MGLVLFFFFDKYHGVMGLVLRNVYFVKHVVVPLLLIKKIVEPLLSHLLIHYPSLDSLTFLVNFQTHWGMLGILLVL